MGRAPCCDKANVKKGAWSPEEDAKLKEYIEKLGTEGNWIALPQKAGLRRCGKSCRLRWLNYLRPNIKHGEFTEKEDRIICSLFATIGSRWSIIASQLPGRTDNDIKNYWNTKLKKKLMGMVPSSEKRLQQATNYPSMISPVPTSPVPTSPSFLYPSQLPSSILSPTTSSAYCFSNNYFPTSSSSFSGYESTIPISSPALMNTTCSSDVSSKNSEVLQSPDSYAIPAHNYESSNSFLIFGGEASCSSSDGSCNNSIISHGLKYEHGVSNGVDENQKLMNSIGVDADGSHEKPCGFYSETPLDYSLEEINQLISTNISNNLNFLGW